MNKYKLKMIASASLGMLLLFLVLFSPYDLIDNSNLSAMNSYCKTVAYKGGSGVICGFSTQSLSITPIQGFIFLGALLSVTYALVLLLRKPIRH